MQGCTSCLSNCLLLSLPVNDPPSYILSFHGKKQKVLLSPSARRTPVVYPRLKQYDVVEQFVIYLWIKYRFGETNYPEYYTHL